MRRLRALIGAMRTRRRGRIDLAQADRLAAGGRPGPEHQGLGHLLDAVRAPATAEELAGERAMVAALAEARRRAVPATPPKGKARVKVPLSARTVVVNVAAGLALLSAGGTAVAARTGNLPAGAQQQAHRLFSALGVPAPRTGGTPAPAPGTRTPGTPVTSRPPVPATPAPPVTIPPGWCRAWRAEPKGKAMEARSRSALIAAAGGEEKVDDYCARLTGSPAATVTTGGATGNGKSEGKGKGRGNGNHGKPSTHPTPHATTPSHPGKPK